MEQTSPHVLLITNDGKLRRWVERVLRHAGCTIDNAEAWQQAKLSPALRYTHYDVALVDVGCHGVSPNPAELDSELKAICAQMSDDVELVLLTLEDAIAPLTSLPHHSLHRSVNGGYLVATIVGVAERRRYRHVHREEILVRLREATWLRAKEQQLARRACILEAIQRAVPQITSLREPGRAFDAICRAVVDIFGVDHSALVIFQPPFEHGRVIAEYPATVGAKNQTIPVRGVRAEEWLMQSMQPLAITDVAHDNQLGQVRDTLLALDIQSILIVPIVHRGRLVGSFSLDVLRTPRPFLEDEIELSVLFAEQIAVMLENVTRYWQRIRRAERLRLLHTIEGELMATLEIGQMLQIIAEGVIKLVGARRSLFLFVNLQTRQLTRVVGYNYPPEHLQLLTFAEIDQGVSGKVLRSGLPELVDAAQDGAWNSGSALESARRFDSKHLVVVPLMIEEAVIGTLTAVNSADDRPFTSDDLDLVEMLAARAILAIEHSERLEHAMSARQRLHALFDSSHTLLASQRPSNVLEAVAVNVQRAFTARAVQFLVLDVLGQVEDTISVGAVIDQEVDAAHHGVVAEVMRSAEPAIFHAVDARIPIVGATAANGVTSVCVPLVLRNRCMGVMWVHQAPSAVIDTQAVSELLLYAKHATVIFDNVRRFEELEALHRAVEALADAASVREVLDQIVRNAQRVLRADSAAIWSYDDADGRFLLDRSVCVGIPARQWEEFKKEEPRPNGTALTVMEQRWVDVDDVSNQQHAAFLSANTRALLQGIGVQSFQGIALIVDDERFGALYVNYRRPCQFSEEQRKSAQTLATFAALALKKACTLDQVSRAQTAAQLVARLTALEETGSTLSSIVSSIQEALGCDVVTLYTYDQQQTQINAPTAVAGHALALGASLLVGNDEQAVVQNILSLDDTYFARNALNDPIMRSPFVQREGIRASVGIPLIVRGGKIGVFLLHYRNPHRFTDGDHKAVTLFAHQAAIAVRNAQLFEQSRRQMQLFQVLYEVGQVTIGSLSLQEILARIAKYACRLMDRDGKHAHFCTLALKEEEHLRFIAAYPPETLPKVQSELGTSIDLSQRNSERVGIVGRAVLQGQPKYVNDVLTDPDYIPFAPTTRSEIVVLLRVRDRIFGAVIVEHPNTHAFNHEDLLTLESLAAQASIIIENARLFEQANKVAERMTIVHKISTVVALSQGAREQILQVAIPEMVKVFGVDHGGVVLYNWSQGYGITQVEYPRTIDPHVPIPLHNNLLVARMQEERKPIAIEDAQTSPLLDSVREAITRWGFRSMLIVPLIVKGEVIGTIGLDAISAPRIFMPDERSQAQIMANNIASAIENAQLNGDLRKQMDDLKQTRDALAGRTAVAWMGILSSTWRHTIDSHATAIVDEVDALKRCLTPDELSPQVARKLAKIRRLGTKIMERPITPSLAQSESETAVPVNQALRERVDAVAHEPQHRAVSLQFVAAMSDGVAVRIALPWLRYAFDILLNNAIEAVQKTPTKQITVTTSHQDGWVVIAVSDTGKGIPQAIRPLLLRQPVRKTRRDKGMGMGLLLAQIIAHNYKGEIALAPHDGQGTTIVIRLPEQV